MNHDDNKLDEKQSALLRHAPIPTLWLFGKTASGKTSVIRYLTGASDAEIGNGFRPQTRYSRLYDFPDEQVPVARFLDTCGVGEAGYDPTEDLAEFDNDADLVIVTVRAMDQATDDIVTPLRQLRKSSSHRPVLLVLTCLHDGYSGEQHPQPDPFDKPLQEIDDSVSDPLRRSIAAQLKRFEGLVDRHIAIDLTPPEEGMEPPDFGGTRLKASILELLPAAYRQTLLQIDELNQEFASKHQRRVAPIILGYSTLAATAAAVPVPWADIPLVLGIQSRLAYRIAKLNNQPLNKKTISHVTAAMGGRIALQMGMRGSLKFIPWIGIAANVAATFAFTFAAGWSWNWYFMEVKAGHLPTNEELRDVFREQLKRGESFWKASKEKKSP